MWLKKRMRSFVFAWNGLRIGISEGGNIIIHIVAILFVTLVGLYVQLPVWKWIVLLFCFGGVVSAELFNTAIEQLANKVSRKKDSLIKRVKDLAAAAVLVWAITAFLIAVLLIGFN